MVNVIINAPGVASTAWRAVVCQQGAPLPGEPSLEPGEAYPGGVRSGGPAFDPESPDATRVFMCALPEDALLGGLPTGAAYHAAIKINNRRQLLDVRVGFVPLDAAAFLAMVKGAGIPQDRVPREDVSEDGLRPKGSVVVYLAAHEAINASPPMRYAPGA